MNVTLANFAANAIGRRGRQNEIRNVLMSNITASTRNALVRASLASQIARNAASVAQANRLTNIMRRRVRARQGYKKYIVRPGQLRGNVLMNKLEAINRMSRLGPRTKAAKAWWSYVTSPRNTPLQKSNANIKWAKFLNMHVLAGGRRNISKENARRMYA